jgi:hypothetical protein
MAENGAFCCMRLVKACMFLTYVKTTHESAPACVPCAAEGGPPFGGYALSESNKVRLCKTEVPQSCLDIKSPDACVNQVSVYIMLRDVTVCYTEQRAESPPGTNERLIVSNLGFCTWRL